MARELPRYVLYTVAISGLLASARLALDPPRPIGPREPPRYGASRDLAAEGFATLFARRYLTWDSHAPEAHRHALASFVGSGMDGDFGLQLPTDGEQRVEWAEVVQQRDPRPAERLYTVAVQTDTAGLLYLTVGVLRSADGPLSLTGYPSFVGAPASNPAVEGGGGGSVGRRTQDVTDPALSTVVDRALRNYLRASASDLSADLSSDAHVSLPGLRLALRAVQSLRWSHGGGSVRAVVEAQDRRSVGYTLDYELDVSPRGDRWEISAIQTNPDS